MRYVIWGSVYEICSGNEGINLKTDKKENGLGGQTELSPEAGLQKIE